MDLLVQPTVSDITDAIKDIEAPVGGEFVLVDMETTVVTPERDTLKVNIGPVRPPSVDLEPLAEACGEAVKEIFPGMRGFNLKTKHYFQ